jgi:hypothetical protein
LLSHGAISAKIFRAHYVAMVALRSAHIVCCIDHVNYDRLRSVESSQNKSGGCIAI